MVDETIFKAYDIRGIYPDQLNEGVSFLIGKALADFLGSQGAIVVGEDMRLSSPAIKRALIHGIISQGSDVIDIGMCSTPMSYFADGRFNASGSAMITASHNPGEYSGFKMCREEAIPIGEASGMLDIKNKVINDFFSDPSREGTVEKRDIVNLYRSHVSAFFRPGNKRLKVVVDCANAMGVLEMKVLEDLSEYLELDVLFGELDGSFPNHEADPLKTETLAALQARVVEIGADVGISFDGDADRCGFVDGHGQVVPMDLITALIAQDILSEGQGNVLYDLRSSRAVKEAILEAGGNPIMSRVGHAFIKQQMREFNAVFAGELSGHYYFKENFNAESSSLAVVRVLNLMLKRVQSLSELIAPLQRYFHSGEINSKVRDKDKVMERLLIKYGNDGRVSRLDGVMVEFDDWWFNVRPSNTEPLLRLNIEASEPGLMAAKRDELLKEIRS